MDNVRLEAADPQPVVAKTTIYCAPSPLFLGTKFVIYRRPLPGKTPKGRTIAGRGKGRVGKVKWEIVQWVEVLVGEVYRRRSLIGAPM